MKRFLPASLVLICLVAVGACGGDDDERTTTPTTTAPATITRPSDEEAVRQVVEDWFERVREITTGEAHAELAEAYLTGDYLRNFVAGVAEREANGETVVRDTAGRTSNRVESITVEGDGATVTQCIVDADLLVDSNGEVLDDSVVARRFESSATRTEDGWRISDRQPVAEWEGAVTCGSSDEG